MTTRNHHTHNQPPPSTQIEVGVFVCATTGNGDAPENAERFWRFLKRRTQPKDMLAKLHYTVLVRDVCARAHLLTDCLYCKISQTEPLSPQPHSLFHNTCLRAWATPTTTSSATWARASTRAWGMWAPPGEERRGEGPRACCVQSTAAFTNIQFHPLPSNQSTL